VKADRAGQCGHAWRFGGGSDVEYILDGYSVCATRLVPWRESPIATSKDLYSGARKIHEPDFVSRQGGASMDLLSPLWSLS